MCPESVDKVISRINHLYRAGSLCGQLLLKFGGDWLCCKLAEECSEVIHDALKLTSPYQYKAQNSKEVGELRGNFIMEMAQAKVYTDLMIEFLGEEEKFEAAVKAQIERLHQKVKI